MMNMGVVTLSRRLGLDSDLALSVLFGTPEVRHEVHCEGPPCCTSSAYIQIQASYSPQTFERWVIPTRRCPDPIVYQHLRNHVTDAICVVLGG